jgi:uncharacterized membrane protein YdbT with pleckstrin-like domain
MQDADDYHHEQADAVREGLISKRTNEIRHSDVRNIQVTQGFFDRIFGVGTIAISSAAQSEVEISFSGLAHPEISGKKPDRRTSGIRPASQSRTPILDDELQFEAATSTMSPSLEVVAALDPPAVTLMSCRPMA